MPESDLEGVQGLSNDDSVGLVQDNDAGILKTTMKSNTGSKVANNVSLAQTQNSQPIDCKRVSSDLMDTVNQELNRRRKILLIDKLS